MAFALMAFEFCSHRHEVVTVNYLIVLGLEFIFISVVVVILLMYIAGEYEGGDSRQLVSLVEGFYYIYWLQECPSNVSLKIKPVFLLLDRQSNSPFLLILHL